MHLGGKFSLLFGSKETEFPGHLRAQTEFGHEEWGVTWAR
jgi:hypothetical protein